MVILDTAELRPKLDLAGKYVDFNLLRATLTVEKVIEDLNIKLTDPTGDGECRGTCPKCGKDRSFAVNVNTNRFHCFAKGCALKGGGVIDLLARLYAVTAKEASHLLACAYGITPYGREPAAANENKPEEETATKETINESVSDAESGEAAEQTAGESSGVSSPDDTPPQLTAAHLIASIEHNLAQLKSLLQISR
jgi:hypothetical protein